MGDAGRAGEGRSGDSLLESIAQELGRGLGHNVAVGVDNVNGCTGGAKRVGNNVASDGGAGDENALATNLGRELGDEAFGYVFSRRERDLEMQKFF